MGVEAPAASRRLVWARHSDGTPFSFSLLTGSSSISHSLKAAIAIANELGHDRSLWRTAAARLATCIRDNEAAFAPKKRWAMDWYYPVMTGVLRGEAGRDRLRAGEDAFIIPNAGVRCVANQDWVTSAETCEAVLAYLAVGETDRAHELFDWAQCNRDVDGAYFTGMVFPDRVNFPGGERSAYTAAAIVLAADALAGTTPPHGCCGLTTHYPRSKPSSPSRVGSASHHELLWIVDHDDGAAQTVGDPTAGRRGQLKYRSLW